MPRRGRVDVPQPILHPIASHATFDTAAPAPTPATATAPQPPSAPEQQQQQKQQHGGKTSRSEQAPPPDQLSFSYLRSRKLEPYLPPPEEQDDDDEEEEEDLDWKPRPFITLTYAQSLDSAIASSPGARTALSGPATKAMTHFLRSRHDAILVGVGTAAADDPGLNCRLEVEMSGGHQPRPVVVDPRGRWEVGAQVKEDGGEEEKVVEEEEDRSRPALTWDSIFGLLWEEGINSVMVEGGATVINDLLLLANEGLDVVDSVIVTVAPVWLGAGGVTVAPERPVDAHMRRVPGPRLTDVMWSQMGDDMVLCGRIMR
ncbi:2,5-diamino-6-(ribosylamino)-4(3H)-pyrimidinone 5'-phosphate reductase [Diaporthe eres]